MKKNPPGPQPTRRLAQQLRAQIVGGDYGPGDKLPTVRTLAQEWGIATNTALGAFRALEEEGLIVAEQGRGFFVRAFRPIIRNSISRVAARQWRGGKSIWERDDDGRALSVDSLQVTAEADAPADVAVLLGDDFEGPVTVRSRRFVVAGQPVMVATSYIPSVFSRGTAVEADDTGPGGVYARLAEAGHGPVAFREDVRARMPSPTEVEALALPAGTPVFEVTRTAAANDGVPVEVNRMVMDGSAFILRYDFNAAD